MAKSALWDGGRAANALTVTSAPTPDGSPMVMTIGRSWATVIETAPLLSESLDAIASSETCKVITSILAFSSSCKQFHELMQMTFADKIMNLRLPI